MRIILNNPYKVATDGQIFVDFGNGFQKYNISDVRTSGITIPSYVTDLSVIKIKTGSEIIKNVNVLFNAQKFSDWDVAQDKEVTITSNDTFVIEPDIGHDALRKVTAHVEVPQAIVQANLETKDVEFNENGYHTVYADEGYDGIGQLNVNVNVPDRQLNLETKEIAFDANGTYYVDRTEGTDGLQQVKIDVNVPNPAVVEDQTLNVTENGVYELTPSEGFEGLGKAVVNVNVNTESHNLEEKFETITENGLHIFEHSPVAEGETPYNGFQSVSALIAVEPKILNVGDQTYTANGDYEINIPEGVDEDGKPWDGLGNIKVHVNVPNPAVVQDKELLIDSNGEYTLEPDAEYEGLGKVTVNVSVPDPEMVLTDEVVNVGEFTEDQKVITPAGDANGLHSVTINAPMDNGEEVIFIDPANPASNERISVENGVITILPQEGKIALKKVKIVLTTSLTDPIYIEPEENESNNVPEQPSEPETPTEPEEPQTPSEIEDEEDTEVNDSDLIIGN